MKQKISSGAPWESIVGYSRAVRVGPHVWVAGTTAAGADGGIVGAGDAYAQTAEILRKIGVALAEAGATMNDVVRSRIFVTDIAQFEGVARAHAEVFGEIRPASTLVEVSAFVSPEMLVEIEVDAYVEGGE
jgi:enamine deaminase RidA (YjgF/YER057c/UK114 family)